MAATRHLHATLVSGRFLMQRPKVRIWKLKCAGGERILDKCEDMSDIQVLDFLSIEEFWELVTVCNDVIYLRKEY